MPAPGPRDQEPVTGSVAPDDPSALVASLYDAFARQDLVAVVSLLDGHIAWHEPDGLRYGGVHIGPRAVITNVIEPMSRDVDGFGIEPEEIIGRDDRIVVLGRYRGRGRATGSRFEIPFAHIWRVEAGRATEFRVYTDTALFNAALAADRR
jgi:ketosteroid isomerase-like protein